MAAERSRRGTPIEVREATLDDAERLRPLAEQLGAEPGKGDLRRRLERLFADPSYKLIVAEERDEIVGLLLVRLGWFLAHDLSHGQLVAIAVDPRYRGSQVFPALLHYAKQLAPKEGLSQIWTLTGIDRPDMHERLRSFGMVATEMKFTLVLDPPESSALDRICSKARNVVSKLGRAMRPDRDAAAPSQEGEGAVGYWTSEQTARFLRSQQASADLPYWRLLLATGLRKREFLSLTWGDVDLERGLIHVPSAFLATLGRTVTLDFATSSLLRRIGPRAPSEPVVAVDADELEIRLETGCAAAGVPYITLDGLGRTHGALLLTAGAPIRQVADRMGHRRVAFTADTFADVLPSSGADLAAMITRILDEPVPPGAEPGGRESELP